MKVNVENNERKFLKIEPSLVESVGFDENKKILI